MRDLSENAMTVLKKRYFKKNEKGECIEDWSALCWRVANNIAGVDERDPDPSCVLKSKTYYETLKSRIFLPNTPTLMNAGNPLQQLSACFVLPVPDSMEGIFRAVKHGALVHKSGGGTGYSFSNLREIGSRVKSTNGAASGPVSFMQVFDSATTAVNQAGVRRGANMGVLMCDHPEIMDFICAKDNLDNLTQFNVSVGITDVFWEALMNDTTYPLISRKDGSVAGYLKAKDVMDEIVHYAWKNGEPGIVFIDEMNRKNPTPDLGDFEATNPCGEQPLLPNEACNLGSIDLAKCIRNLGERKTLDVEKLIETIYIATEFLDAVIDRSEFPLDEIKDMVSKTRKIGLGVMGWADLLYILKIPYNSEEACELGSILMEIIDFHSKVASVSFGGAKGSFPAFDGSIYSNGCFTRDAKAEEWDPLIRGMKLSMRNATTTTVAPTGSISMIADTSGGIEPQFSLVYVKNVMDGEKLLYINPYFEKAIRDAGIYSKELMEKVCDTGSIADLHEIPEAIRKVFVTSHDISPEWHVKMQASFQRFCDAAISKTVNFSHTATKEDVMNAYILAHDMECKGITVYRDGSRSNQVMNLGDSLTKEKTLMEKAFEAAGGEVIQENVKLPDCAPSMCYTRRDNGGTTWYFNITFADKEQTVPFAMFITTNKSETSSVTDQVISHLEKVLLGCGIKPSLIERQSRKYKYQSNVQKIARIISMCLRHNVGVHDIVTELSTFPAEFSSLIYHVKKVLSQFITDGVESEEKCPECGAVLSYQEGCLSCSSRCGYSVC